MTGQHTAEWDQSSVADACTSYGKHATTRLEVVGETGTVPLVVVHHHGETRGYALLDVARDVNDTRRRAPHITINEAVKAWVEQLPPTERETEEHGIACVRWGVNGHPYWAVAVPRENGVAWWTRPTTPAIRVGAIRRAGQLPARRERRDGMLLWMTDPVECSSALLAAPTKLREGVNEAEMPFVDVCYVLSARGPLAVTDQRSAERFTSTVDSEPMLLLTDDTVEQIRWR